MKKSKFSPDFKKCNIFCCKCSVDDANISNQSLNSKEVYRKVMFVSSDSEDISEDDEASNEINGTTFFLFIKNGGNYAY